MIVFSNSGIASSNKLCLIFFNDNILILLKKISGKKNFNLIGKGENNEKL